MDEYKLDCCIDNPCKCFTCYMEACKEVRQEIASEICEMLEDMKKGVYGKIYDNHAYALVQKLIYKKYSLEDDNKKKKGHICPECNSDGYYRYCVCGSLKTPDSPEK